jgi:hypothetical protein
MHHAQIYTLMTVVDYMPAELEGKNNLKHILIAKNG